MAVYPELSGAHRCGHWRGAGHWGMYRAGIRAAGREVAALDIDEKGAAEVVREITAAGGKGDCHSHRCDRLRQACRTQLHAPWAS